MERSFAARAAAAHRTGTADAANNGSAPARGDDNYARDTKEIRQCHCWPSSPWWPSGDNPRIGRLLLTSSTTDERKTEFEDRPVDSGSRRQSSMIGPMIVGIMRRALRNAVVARCATRDRRGNGRDAPGQTVR